MEGASFAKKLAIVLTMVLAVGSLALADQTAQPKKKKPTLQPESPAPQTAPADSKAQKGKPKTTDPANAGWLTVKGRIVTVQPERRAVIIRTDTTDYQVYVTDKTTLTRDGKATDIKALQVNDRVESCHFNAKRAIQTLKVISVEKSLVPNPNPEREAEAAAKAEAEKPKPETDKPKPPGKPQP
jgi:hypothetical protein